MSRDRISTHHVPCPGCGIPSLVEVHKGFKQTRTSPAEPSEIVHIHSGCDCPPELGLTEERAWTWLESNQPDPFDDPRIP